MRNELSKEAALGAGDGIPEDAPEAIYRSPHPIAAIGFILLGLGLLLLEIYLANQVLEGQIRGKMAMIPWLLPIAIVFFLVPGTFNLLNPITVAVYPHGFLYTRGRSVDFCPWDRITTFWCHRQCVPNTAPSSRYWVMRDDEVVFAFKSKRLNGVEEFAAGLYAEVHERLLAPALKAYAAGESVSFGPIAIDREGLTYRGEHLPWDRITSAAADLESDFVVQKAGKTYAWCELSTARIPNFPILQELLDEHAREAA